MPGWGDDDEEPDERARLEAENAHRQARMVRSWVRRSVRHMGLKRSPLTLAQVLYLNWMATRWVLPTAGQLRTRSDVEIAWSGHTLPPHEQVRALLVEACDYVNSRPEADAIHLAAFILWRICWIHPFDDGNGRTARAVSYLVLCQHLRVELGGKHPIPDRIKKAPLAYVQALEAADRAWKGGKLDVSALERLLAHYLEAQLRDDPPGLPPWA